MIRQIIPLSKERITVERGAALAGHFGAGAADRIPRWENSPSPIFST